MEGSHQALKGQSAPMDSALVQVHPMACGSGVANRAAAPAQRKTAARVATGVGILVHGPEEVTYNQAHTGVARHTHMEGV